MAVTDIRSGEQLVRERVAALLAGFPPDRTPVREFLGARFDHGLAWVHFPEGHGGLGLTPDLQGVVEAELRRAGAPVPDFEANPIGLGMAAPTIAVHGTDEQKRRYLRPIFTGEEIWCQLFSEPGAGSDFASIATRAVRDGDEWVVTGQKVWTTLAHVARWGLLAARTDPDVPKHRGITYFILDMHAPGVDVRPLRQITGEAEFNEVFMTEVRVPDSQRLGDVNDGWRVSLTTLMNERVAIGGGVAQRGSGPIGEAVRIWKERGLTDPARRDRLMRLWVRAEALRLTNMRARQLRRAGTPGPEGSVSKLASAELNKEIYELCVDLLGPEGMLYPEGYEMRRPERAGMSARDVRWSFLRSRANSIEGGTSEIMRNILGERVLGLPREPGDDRTRPFRDLPKNA
ncbi:MAG: acyl-CoA dehydrogenase [Chloroflexota bacterium]